MVKLPEQYPYSSYKYYAYGKDDPMLDRDVCYNPLGKNDPMRQREYRELVDSDSEQIGRAIGRQLFLGSDEYIKRMEKKFGVKNIRMERGRPKRDK
jgi:hypothetical protein